MDFELRDGKYVVGVSGGVDSVVLLDLLAKWTVSSSKSSQVIVAHFDHAIRPNSSLDVLFVEKLAKSYGLPFVAGQGNLGLDASEERAREARYGFLKQVLNDNNASAMITAHHQDDVLETAILNILRGTGRRGISSLKTTKEVIRPLLAFPKSTLVNYAKTSNLKWREDSTNTDKKYKRNYVRHHIIPKLSAKQRSKLLQLISDQSKLNHQIDNILGVLLEQWLEANNLPRLRLLSLDSTLSKEVIAAWLRLNKLYGYDQNGLNRLDSQLKVGKVNSRVSALDGWQVSINKDNLALVPIER